MSEDDFRKAAKAAIIDRLHLKIEGPSEGEPATGSAPIPEDISVEDLARLLEEAAAGG